MENQIDGVEHEIQMAEIIVPVWDLADMSVWERILKEIVSAGILFGKQ